MTRCGNGLEWGVIITGEEVQILRTAKPVEYTSREVIRRKVFSWGLLEFGETFYNAGTA